MEAWKMKWKLDFYAPRVPLNLLIVDSMNNPAQCPYMLQYVSMYQSFSGIAVETISLSFSVLSFSKNTCSNIEERSWFPSHIPKARVPGDPS